jgi:signal transduction histidine kinase
LLAQASSSNGLIELIDLRIDEILWHARDELKRRHPRNSVDIEFMPTVDDEKYLIVKGNESLLGSALINFMENGCKFSDNQHVTVTVSQEKSRLILHFIDEGHGMHPDEVARIFVPFYRTAAAMSKQGYGIGMPLANKIISLHKGTITIRSEVGKGSDFMVTLPLADHI